MRNPLPESGFESGLSQIFQRFDPGIRNVASTSKTVIFNQKKLNFSIFGKKNFGGEAEFCNRFPAPRKLVEYWQCFDSHRTSTTPVRTVRCSQFENPVLGATKMQSRNMPPVFLNFKNYPQFHPLFPFLVKISNFIPQS